MKTFLVTIYIVLLTTTARAEVVLLSSYCDPDSKDHTKDVQRAFNENEEI